MKFLFRLDRLLHLRVSAERQQARILRDAMASEERERLQRDVCAERCSKAEQQKAQLAPTGARAGTLVNLQRSLDVFSERTVTADTVHQEAVKRMELARGGYRRARQLCRTLERLRERRMAEWMYEEFRHDQAVTDEVAGRRRSQGESP